MAKLTKKDFTRDEAGEYYAGSHSIAIRPARAGISVRVASSDWYEEDVGRSATVCTESGFVTVEDALLWGIDRVNEIPLRLACIALEIAFASMAELFPLALAAIERARAEAALAARADVFEECAAIVDKLAARSFGAQRVEAERLAADIRARKDGAT